MDERTILWLRMRRQHLLEPADEAQYLALYRDMQPGFSVYWNGFGQPPVLSFRAAFDDLAFNRRRQLGRELVKGRFGGSLGWIVPEDMGLFRALYRKPLTRPNAAQAQILELIRHLGPLTIHQIKEETGLLVKEITPALHRLQEAFLLFEDQFDGEWDRGWCLFEEMFPEIDEPPRAEAIETTLRRFARRMVRFDSAMAKSFYRLPEREIKSVLDASAAFVHTEGGWMLREDAEAAAYECAEPMRFVLAIHRNDMLYKAQENALKARFAPLYARLPYDHEPLQYLLIDGEFRGAVVGHLRNGPYDLNDVVTDLPSAHSRREEILEAVRQVNFGRSPARFMGEAAL